jgi:hypothetical protein
VNRSGISLTYQNQASELLLQFAAAQRAYVTSQVVTTHRQFEQINSPHRDESSVMQASLETFDRLWTDESTRLNTIPGKEALKAINTRLQELYGITLTATAIIDAMLIDEVPAEMLLLLAMLAEFIATTPGDDTE